MDEIFVEFKGVFTKLMSDDKTGLKSSVASMLSITKRSQMEPGSAQRLAFVFNGPFKAVISKHEPSSTVVLDCLEIYILILEKCRFKDIRQTIHHFEFLPEFLKTCSKEPTETVLEKLSIFLRTLLCSNEKTFRVSLEDEKAIPFMSAVIFHMIAIEKRCSTKVILQNSIMLFQYLLTEETFELVKTIFPGVLSMIVRSIMGKSVNFISWLSFLGDLVVIFLENSEAEPIHLETIAAALSPVLSKIISSKNESVISTGSSVGKRLYPLVKDLQNDLLDLLAYSRSFDQTDPQDIFVIPKSKRLVRAEALMHDFGDINHSSTILRATAGLLESFASAEIILFIEIPLLISRLLNNLEPDFTTVPPIVVTECVALTLEYGKTDHHPVSQNGHLSEFTPKHFSNEDFQMVTRIINVISQTHLVEEIFDILKDEASLRPASAFFLGAIILKSSKHAPFDLVRLFNSFELPAIQNRSSLGTNIIFVHFLVAALKLLLDNDSEFCRLLYTLLYYCASPHPVLANLALSSLSNLSDMRGSSMKIMLNDFLEPLMSNLLARLQHMNLYPSSPRVFSALLDLLGDGDSDKVDILTSAFGEIVGFVEESNGADLPMLNSALRALARFHGEPQDVVFDLEELVDEGDKETIFQIAAKRLCIACISVMGLRFNATVTISSMELVGHFCGHLAKVERPPLVAKAFPRLMNRLEDTDSRVGARVPQVLRKVYLCSGDFLDGRMIDEYLPRAKRIVRAAHDRNYDSFSSKSKRLLANLEFFKFIFNTVDFGSDRRMKKLEEAKECVRLVNLSKMPSIDVVKKEFQIN